MPATSKACVQLVNGKLKADSLLLTLVEVEARAKAVATAPVGAPVVPVDPSVPKIRNGSLCGSPRVGAMRRRPTSRPLIKDFKMRRTRIVLLTWSSKTHWRLTRRPATCFSAPSLRAGAYSTGVHHHCEGTADHPDGRWCNSVRSSIWRMRSRVARLLRERIDHFEGSGSADALTRKEAKPDKFQVIASRAFKSFNPLRGYGMSRSVVSC
ncbi:MAG: hypothetical protein U5K74_09360 [Gemmatimonadaceae bacterium]|nr:hypothetical protein [Gemmatimonadaceae bacterium]